MSDNSCVWWNNLFNINLSILSGSGDNFVEISLNLTSKFSETLISKILSIKASIEYK